MSTLRALAPSFSSLLIVALTGVALTGVALTLGGCGGGDGNGGGGSGKGANAGGDVAAGMSHSQTTCMTAICHVAGSVTGAPMLAPAVEARNKELANYEDYVAKLRVQEKATYEANQAQIDGILAATGDERLEKWLRAYLTLPTFDDPAQKMPALVPPLTDTQMNDVIAYLMTLK